MGERSSIRFFQAAAGSGSECPVLCHVLHAHQGNVGGHCAGVCRQARRHFVEGAGSGQAEVVEQLARETGMDLRVLDARQDIAWAASLPLGLAPSTLLAS